MRLLTPTCQLLYRNDSWAPEEARAGCSRFYWVLLGSTGFYRVLLGSTGFCWVLPGSAGFCWVLSDFFNGQSTRANSWHPGRTCRIWYNLAERSVLSPWIVA